MPRDGERKRDRREDARFARPERPGDRFETRVHLLEGDARRAHEERKGHHHHRDDDGSPREDDVHAEKGMRGAPARAAAAQELQEQEPGRDGREDERKGDERLEEGLSRKAPPREEQREREPEGREEEDGESRHAEREPDDGQVHGELGHVSPSRGSRIARRRSRGRGTRYSRNLLALLLPGRPLDEREGI